MHPCECDVTSQEYKTGAYLEAGPRGPPPPIAHAQEIFTLFKYPNIGKDTSKLHRNSTKIAEVVL